MIEIITAATLYTCSSCILLTSGGSYMSVPGQPYFCFGNHLREWKKAEEEGKPRPYYPEDGIEVRTRPDGVMVFTIGKNIEDCR